MDLAREGARLGAHFDRTLAALVRAPAPSPRRARRRRERMLDALARYRDRRRFPRNERVAHRTPIFVDTHETRCAMACLIETSGERALVDRIARTRNEAFIRELASDGELVAWLAAHGLTAAEAARIQPDYAPMLGRALTSCGGPNATAVVRVVLPKDGGPTTVEAVVAGTTSVGVGASLHLDATAFDQDHFLVAVDASGTPTAQPLPESQGSVAIETAQHTLVYVSEADAARIVLAADCRNELTALVDGNDGGAPDAGTSSHATGGCATTRFGGGDVVAVFAALLALRHARRRW